MGERTLPGFAAAPGLAAGGAICLKSAGAADGTTVPALDRMAEAERALGAIEIAASRLDALAERLRQEERREEADMVEAGALMARDPALAAEARRLVLESGRPAGAALIDAAEEFADRLATLKEPGLAERADDIRSVGRRAALLLSGGLEAAGPAGGILVAADLGPADMAELGPQLSGIALARGGVTAHAAIVARSLGIPMVVGLGPSILDVETGEDLVVDGDEAVVVRHPSAGRLQAAQLDRDRRRSARARAIADRDLPTVTRAGRRVRVLANAATTAELEEALLQGAEGIGLLRTELLFLDADVWPSAARHHRVLAPLLRLLPGRTATVRLLDFGGDKTPPFLAGAKERGIQLLLRSPEALRAQLDGISSAAAAADVRVLIPMVTSLEQIESVRTALEEGLRGRPRPAVGAMIETPEAALAAAELAPHLDFMSLGTNDLTQLVLGRDRESSRSSPTAHPAVLDLIERTIRAAHERGIPVEVCGEAASDPATVPLLVELGADELSVGAARVGEVRELLRGL